MSKFDEALATYSKFLKEKAGAASVDEPLLRAVSKGLGPTLYNADASVIAGSDPKEIERIRKNFLVKKLGLKDSDELDASITEVMTPFKSSSRKHRAVVYYLLTKKFKKESVYTA